jgi:hypothetical protein
MLSYCARQARRRRLRPTGCEVNPRSYNRVMNNFYDDAKMDTYKVASIQLVNEYYAMVAAMPDDAPLIWQEEILGRTRSNLAAMAHAINSRVVDEVYCTTHANRFNCFDADIRNTRGLLYPDVWAASTPDATGIFRKLMSLSGLNELVLSFLNDEDLIAMTSKISFPYVYKGKRREWDCLPEVAAVITRAIRLRGVCTAVDVMKSYHDTLRYHANELWNMAYLVDWDDHLTSMWIASPYHGLLFAAQRAYSTPTRRAMLDNVMSTDELNRNLPASYHSMFVRWFNSTFALVSVNVGLTFQQDIMEQMFLMRSETLERRWTSTNNQKVIVYDSDWWGYNHKWGFVEGLFNFDEPEGRVRRELVYSGTCAFCGPTGATACVLHGTYNAMASNILSMEIDEMVREAYTDSDSE